MFFRISHLEILSILESKYLNFPDSATEEEWEKLHLEAKTKTPIKYFFIYQLPDFIYDNILPPIIDIIYWIKYRIIPSYRKLWIIKPRTLKIGFNDTKDLILHSSMQLASEFYEFQISDKSYSDWDCGEERKKVFSELKEIYIWWKKYIRITTNLYKLPISMKESKEIFEIFEELEEYDNWLKQQDQLDIKLEEESVEMLIRLSKINKYLTWD